MMQIRVHIYIISLLILSSCIKPFDPGLDQNSTNKYVVQGMVSSIEGWQYVYVSKSSSVALAEFIPVIGCQIVISDDQGNTFNLNESDAGTYLVWMNSIDLVPGRSYMIRVQTPDGQILESAYDKMPNGPDDIGEIYTEVENTPTNDPDYNIYGAQFYLNFSAAEEDSRYYRWKLTETWEYYTEYPIEFYYDGAVHQVSPPDTSQKYCWKTQLVQDVFTLSTVHLTENALNGVPLNFIYSSSNRLEVLYSLLIEQSALSEDAFNYWDKLRVNSLQDGGLYTTQPLAIKGNIKNISNPDNEVLGFFQASSVSTKRIFVEPLPDLVLNIPSLCQINLLEHGGFLEISPLDYPAYLFSSNGQWSMATLTKECVLCSAQGGSNVKPDFWP